MNNLHRFLSQHLPLLTSNPKCVIVTDIGMGGRNLASVAMTQRNFSRVKIPVVLDGATVRAFYMREMGGAPVYYTPQYLVRNPDVKPCDDFDYLIHMQAFGGPKTKSWGRMLEFIDGASQGIFVIHAWEHSEYPGLAPRFSRSSNSWIGLDKREFPRL